MGTQGNYQVQPAMGGAASKQPMPYTPRPSDPSLGRPNVMPRPSAPSIGQPNVFESSAAAMRGAGTTYGDLANFQAPTMEAAQIGQAGTLASTNLDPYMNPYTQNVIDRTQQDIMRQQQMAQNQLGAQASQAGAFGGSRHGVAEGVMAGEYGRMAGDIAAQQRQRAYDQAMGAAQYDIGGERDRLARQAELEQAARTGNVDAAFRAAGVRAGGASGLSGLGGQLFGMGQQTQDAIARQGAFQRQIQQQLADAARNQFYGSAGAPLQGLGALTSVLGGVRVPQTSTTSTPFNPLGLLTAFI